MARLNVHHVTPGHACGWPCSCGEFVSAANEDHRQIYPDRWTFACAFCRTEHVVYKEAR